MKVYSLECSAIRIWGVIKAFTSPRAIEHSPSEMDLSGSR